MASNERSGLLTSGTARTRTSTSTCTRRGGGTVWTTIMGAFTNTTRKNSELVRSVKSSYEGKLGGSRSMGNFHIKETTTPPTHPPSSRHNDNRSRRTATAPDPVVGRGHQHHRTLTPSEMGQQQLYTQLPFQAVFGLQKKEREVATAFATYAADLDVESRTTTAMYSTPTSTKTTTNANATATSPVTVLVPHDENAMLNQELRRTTSSMIILDEMDDSNVVTAPLIFAVIVVAALTFLAGYNSGVMNPPEAVIFPGHTISSWALAVSAFAAGGPFGSNVGGKLADQRGRREAIVINICIFLIGGVLQTMAHSMMTIIMARFIIGFGSGMCTVLVPIYLGEMAPPSLRGTFGTLTQFAQVIGILVSSLIAVPFATIEGWRILFAVTVVIAIGQLGMAHSGLLLESPRWLLNRNPESLRARYIIKRLRGLRNEHEVEMEVGNFLMGESAHQHPNEDENDGGCRSGDGDGEDRNNNNTTVMNELWADPKRRKLLLSCLVLQVAQQLSGINAVIMYSTSFFNGVIDNPLIGTNIINVVNLVSTYVALRIMDSVGRKSLLLVSSGGMFLSCIAVVLALLGFVNNIIALVAVSVYIFFFAIGMGPIPWLIVAEMFDGKYVSVAMSMCSQLNWICNFIVSLVFPYMNAYLGPYSFFPFAVVLACTFLFALFVLPETQGKTPEEMVALVRTQSQSMSVYEINEDDTSDAINLEWKKAMDELMKEEQQKMNDGSYDYGFKPIQTNTEHTSPFQAR